MRSNCILNYMLSVTHFDPKGTFSEVRAHGGAKFGHAARWSTAKCRFSTKVSIYHHGKVKKKVKGVSKNKKPEHPRSVRNYEAYVIDYACEDPVRKLKTGRRQRLDN